MTKIKKWNAIHYNAIAKDIREEFQGYLNAMTANSIITTQADYDKACDTARDSIGALTRLALRFAKRFYDDCAEADEGLVFDPLMFLDQCSPDPDSYPLSELWREYG